MTRSRVARAPPGPADGHRHQDVPGGFAAALGLDQSDVEVAVELVHDWPHPPSFLALSRAIAEEQFQVQYRHGHDRLLP